MTFIFQQLITLLPLLILGLTVIIVMLFIAWKRDHIMHATISVTGFIFALFSLWFVAQNEPIDITLLLRIDNYSVFYITLVILASIASCIFAYPWLVEYTSNREEFYLLILVSALGGIILSTANHLVSLLLGIELLSLPLFGLIGYGFQRKICLEAAIKYTVLSSVSSSFILFGIGIIYIESSSLSFPTLGIILGHDLINKPLVLTGIGMMIIGLGFKLSLVPFHLWTPDVYQGAPTPVSTFLSTASKIAIFSVVMRFFIYTSLVDHKAICTILSSIAILSMLCGNLMAITQKSIKRILGYSSISHMGYLLVVLVAIKTHRNLSIETENIYLVSYLFSTLGIFGIVCFISNLYKGVSNSDSLYFYRGLFWHHPMMAVAMTIMLLSLAGIPITLGFIGKLYLIILAVNAHLWFLIASIVVGSAIGLYYYLRITINLYLNPRAIVKHKILKSSNINMTEVVIFVSAILVLILGIYPQPLVSLVKLALPLM